MSIHYKFKAAKEYDTLPIDGLHISLVDLKSAINHHKRLGKFACDLKVTDAETNKVYEDDKDLICKNTNLIIARIPIDPALRKFGDAMNEDKELLLANPDYRMNIEGAEEAELIQRRIEEVPDITKLAGTESEKIAVMMAQSTIKFHPSRYLRLRNTVMSGKVPASFKCHKCHQGGHWVPNCPLNSQDIRKCTGIPSKFLEEVSDSKTPGVMITTSGKYVILRQKMNTEVKAKIRPKFIEPPDDLICPICKDILNEAALIPCCANAYCDDCIRNHLLDCDGLCPACNATDIGPDTLIPNRYLRTKVLQFGLQYIVDDDEKSAQPSPKSNSAVSSPKLKPIESDMSSPKVKGSDEEIEVLAPSKTITIKDVMEDEVAKKKADEVAKMKAEEVAKRKADEASKEAASAAVVQSTEIKVPVSPVGEKGKDGKAKKKKKEKKNKKEKKEKKLKKDKKDKKNKKDKKKDRENTDKTAKDVSSENLMNEAICPTFDTSVPPPNFSQYGAQSSSTNLYDNLGRPDVAAPFGGSYKAEIEDTLSPFLDFLRKKDEEKKRKNRSPSPGARYRGSRSRSRDPAVSTYSRLPGSDSRSSSVNRSRSRSPHARGNSPYSKRPRRYSPEKQGAYSPYKGNRPMVQREFNPYQVYPTQEPDYFGGSAPISSDYMDQVNRYSRNSDVMQQQYHRGYQHPSYQDNSRQFAGYGQPAYQSYSRYEQHPDYRNQQQDYRRKMAAVRDNYREGGRFDETTHPYQRGRHSDEGYRPARDSRRYEDSSKESPPTRVYKTKEEYDRKHSYDYKKKSRHSSSPDLRQEDKRKSNGEDKPSQKSGRAAAARRSRSPVREPVVREARKKSRSPHKESTKRSRSPNKEFSSYSTKSRDSDGHGGKRTRSPSEYVVRKRRRTPTDDSPRDKNVAKEEKKDNKDNKKAEPKDEKVAELKRKEEKEAKKSKKKKKEKKKKEKTSHKSKSSGSHSVKDHESKDDTNSQQTLSPVRSPEMKGGPAANSGVYFPELSKWERDDDATFSPAKTTNSSKPNESSVVTSDVLKKAENVLFSKGLTSRSLMPRKIYPELKTDVGDKDKTETRETKKKGSSIQITISSKTESQIGKPKSKIYENEDCEIRDDKDTQNPLPEDSKHPK